MEELGAHHERINTSLYEGNYTLYLTVTDATGTITVSKPVAARLH